VFERVFRKLGYYTEREANRMFKPEAAAYQFYCEYLGPEDVVLEAGAYRGYTTVGLLVNVAKFVYALEPDPDNFRHLRDNCRGLEDHIRPLNLGLSDREEVREVRGRGSYSNFVKDLPKGGATARLVSLDSLNLDPSPTVLVLDCEGMEHLVIDGARKTIERSVHSTLVEIHEDTEPMVRDALKRAGLADIEVHESGWSRPWRPDEYHDRWVAARRPQG